MKFLFIAVPALVGIATAQTAKYTGPGSCASPSCHGGVQSRSTSSVGQNEYSTWVVADKHSQAYTALSNPIAMGMAKILKIPNPGETPKCLACHALDVPAAMRARTFDIADGVSCESCHGPSSNWLGPHTTQTWTHQKSLDAGMYDTRDLIRRSEKCLSCHLGTPDKFVDHEMLAAGHPDLYFELASFQAVMPRHWKVSATEDPLADVRALAVGQAVQLREQLSKITREAQNGPWPELSDFDCFACHHSLTEPKNSWRQQLGYARRKAGNPPWNLSRYVVLRRIANEVNSELSQRLAAQIESLYASASSLAPDRARIASRASTASETANALSLEIAAARFDPERLLKEIAADGDYIAAQDERAAEQAAMALDSLFVAWSARAKIEKAEQIRSAIQALFKQLDDPSSYNAYKFAEQLRVLRNVLK